MKRNRKILAVLLAAGMALAGACTASAAVRNGLNFWSSGHYHTAYMFPDSGERFLTEQDLDGYTGSELRIGRNEIYARHGRMFSDRKLQEYFLEKLWYSPSVTPDAFRESMLNSVE